MCIVFLHYSPDGNGRYLLIAINNRDEFYDRETLPACFWPDCQDVIAGKDLVNGGSWLGFSKEGRFAVLTNYRKEFGCPLFLGKSRGALVMDYLSQNTSTAKEYCQGIIPEEYDTFNLVVGQLSGPVKQLVYCSNQDGTSDVRTLESGIYGLSNASLDSPWLKVTKGKAKFTDIVNNSANISKDELTEQLLQLLSDDTCFHPDPNVHETHHPDDWLVGMNSIFVKVPQNRYGTRTSTVILVDREGVVTYTEKTMVDPINVDDPQWNITTETFNI